MDQVWKDIQNADVRRQLYVRQRSYASAPGSRIGIKIDEELNVEDGGAAGVRTSTISEPIAYTRHSTSEYFVSSMSKKLTPKFLLAKNIQTKNAPQKKSTKNTESVFKMFLCCTFSKTNLLRVISPLHININCLSLTNFNFSTLQTHLINAKYLCTKVYSVLFFFL